MKTMIQWELWRRRSFITWWSVGVTLLIALTVLTYGTVADKADDLNKAFGDLSQNIGSFVGTTDMFSPAGYLNSQLYFITLPILLIILGVTLAKSLLGKEEDDRTLELLLARPVSRRRMLAAKAAAGFTILTIVGAVAALATMLCALAVGLDISLPHLLLTTCVTTYFSGAFSAVAFACLAAHRLTRGLALLIAVLFSFGSYIITSLSGMVDWLEPLSKALPYHYYDPGALLVGDVAIELAAYIAGVYLVTALAAAWGFEHRDIA